MLFTIGYATKPFATFIDQLKHHEIDVVADVRSVPFSKLFIDYHQTALEKTLPQHEIKYVHLGKELGPRSKDPAHYDSSGQVQFSALMGSTLFLQGIERLNLGLTKGFNIALLCAEKDPAGCHRSLLVSYYLTRAQRLEIQHIDHEGKLESQAKLEQRLITQQDLSVDLLTPAAELAQLAYEQQLKQTSYRK
ncbi:MAG: hypothetical protein ACI95C_002731 [Pseudohongiellaceae bacterium]|jgi:uncharacterized protein (DUF488 family)